MAETLLYDAWKAAAGKDSSSSVAAEKVSFRASDGVVLGGYHLQCAQKPTGQPCFGSLLIIQGNAMLVGPFMDQLTIFATHGFDVYAYDFRGYGISGGISRSSDLISDYREIIASFANRQPRIKFFLYGGSLGGMILTNAIGNQAFNGMVLDSVPSKSPIICSSSLDPKNNLPTDATNIMLISGTSDNVVKPKRMKELLESAAGRHATIWQPEGYHHIFYDPYEDQKRFIHAIEFFKREGASQ